MEVMVVADSHLYKTPDGKYWAQTIYGYNFWERYLEAFEKVAIVSRTKHVDSINTEKYLRVDGHNVRVVELPYLRGMKEYVKSYYSLRKAAKHAIKNAEIAIFRLPSVVASVVLDIYKKTEKPYSIEVVVDPYDAYSSNKIAQTYFTRKLKKDVLSANGVSYVTQFYLQSKYPSTARISGETKVNFESYYSSIDLKYDFFSSPRNYDKKAKVTKIVHTANNINNDVKGHLTLLKITKKLISMKYDIEVIFIGDGSKRPYFENIAKDYNIDQNITFTGLLSTTEDVRNVLLEGDIFVFPTKAEGLPRAIIEAMAVGLPCLSTPVNGIPELLKKDYLFEPDDINGFTEKIVELINNSEQLNKMSVENIEKATDYIDFKLNERRRIFYSKLKTLGELSKI